MARGIVEIQRMGDALRNTGYKNIESAVSEIIDNSIEFGAENIFVILGEGISNGRKVVNEMGFLDDGEGMPEDILEGCLVLGETTHRVRGKGIGRFGVGLPQSSMYACPEVEVYSWQDGIENCKMVYLDINKVSRGEQKEIPSPLPCDVPDKYKDFINYSTTKNDYDFSKSGTLVIWKNCDRVTPKTREPLIRHLEFAVGQKFRYFINEENCSIKIIALENQDAAVDVYPNDPLFLMPNNYVLCDPKNPGKAYIKEQREGLEPCFEPYGAEEGITIPIKYTDASGNVAESEVTVRFSIVKDKFYDKTAFPKADPGSYDFGKKFARRMEGISIVRANREIDFRKFDFYENINQPEHRWWGCEIRFMPELDEVFGVANNKQQVELDRVDADDIDHADEVQPVWQQLQIGVNISDTIGAMYKRNKKLRENSRSKGDPSKPAEEIVNTVEGDITDGTPSASKNVAVSETLIEMGKEELKKQGVDEPTEDEVREFLDSKIRISYQPLGNHGQPAFEYGFELGIANVTVNLDHDFYTAFLQKIYEGNPEVKTTFELFLASFVMAVKETTTTQEEQNDELVTLWNEKLRKYIKEQLKPGD